MLVGARYMTVSAGRPWRRRGRPENCCAEVPLGRVLDPLAVNTRTSIASWRKPRPAASPASSSIPCTTPAQFLRLFRRARLVERCPGRTHDHAPRLQGAAPDGSTWNLLANRAGGKRQPGITGVSRPTCAPPASFRATAAGAR